MPRDLRVLLYGRKPVVQGGTERYFHDLRDALAPRVGHLATSHVGEEASLPPGERFDVLHAIANFPSAPRLAKQVGAKHVFTVHCSPTRNSVHGWETGRRGAYRAGQLAAFAWDHWRVYRDALRASAVIVHSAENERDVRRQLPGIANRTFLVPLGIFPDRFPPGDPDDGFAFYVGRLERSKGIDLAVQVLTEEGLPFKVAGKGSLEPALRQTAGPHVEFLGEIPDATLADHYRRASVCLFPSLMEGFGLVALEALASGAPTIVTDAFTVPPPAAQLMRKIPKRNAAALRAAIQAEWGTKTPARAKRAHDVVRAHHTMDQYAEGCLRVYDEVLRT